MFMDSMISPINVHSMRSILFTKHVNTKVSMFLSKENQILGFPCCST